MHPRPLPMTMPALARDRSRPCAVRPEATPMGAMSVIAR
ncbi:unnamed protein product [[Actinomadura] parvosata subsp. kistnae]|nr:unnamed protein product [Actinomadura parvosata subsp. kistnae]